MSDIEPLLVAYVDGELDEAGIAEVERMLADNEAARRSVQIYRETAALLRAACAESVYAAGSMPFVAVPRPARIARWRRPLAVAAAVLLLLIGYGAGWMTAPGADDDEFIDDVAEYHEVYSRETTHLAEVPAEQTDEIERWLGARLRRPIVPPDLRTEGLRFAGARLWISDGKPVADLLYTRADGLPVAFCIVHAADPPMGNSGIEVTSRGDLRVAFWQSQGYTFAVVGELSVERAREIAEQARRPSGT
jgi:anti-sigma factor RsiW